MALVSTSSVLLNPATGDSGLTIFKASGIGKATALAYARNGTRGLVLADLDEPGVQRTAKQAKQEATNDEFSVIALHADVRDYSTVENVFEHAVKKFGRIDYSVNTAGVSS